MSRSMEVIKRMNGDRALFLKLYGLVNYYLDENQEEVIKVKEDIKRLIECLDKKLYNELKQDIDIETKFLEIPF